MTYKLELVKTSLWNKKKKKLMILKITYILINIRNISKFDTDPL